MNAIQIICHLNSRSLFSVNYLCFIIPHYAHIKLLESIKLVSCEKSDLFISGVEGWVHGLGVQGDQYAASIGDAPLTTEPDRKLNIL